jgi:hypothetical protein
MTDDNGTTNFNKDWYDVPKNKHAAPSLDSKSYKDLSLYHLVMAKDHIYMVYDRSEIILEKAINDISLREAVYEEEYHKVLDMIVDVMQRAHTEYGGDEIVLP